MKRFIVFLVVVLGMGIAGGAQAQTPPYPNGCSVGLPLWAQHGLDAIFNGACDNHDNCWAQCNGARGPFFGLQHRGQCDQAFLGDLTAACALRGAQLAFPIVGLEGGESLAEFLAVCEGVALSFYGAVSTPIGTGLYWTSQCLRGCNPMACMQSGFFFPTSDGRPPTCGHPPYTGHFFCYRQPYTPDYCDFHQCPGFLTATSEGGLPSLPDFLTATPKIQVAVDSGEPPPSAEEDPKAEEPEDSAEPKEELQGGECSTILDWFCCACQYCPNCLL